VEIKNERIYDQGYLIPSMNGVNDPRMGSVDKDRICFTCKGNNVDCPGHFGHIELSKPMYHIGFIEDIRKIMRCVCFNCSKVLAPRDKDQRDSIGRVRGSKTRFFLVQQKCEKASKICDLNSGGCGMRQPKLSKKGLGIEVEYQIDGKNDQCTSFMESLGFQSADKKQTVWPEDVLRVLSNISDEDQALLGVKKPSNMIMRRLLVAPPPVRPSVSMGGGGLKCEDDLTYAY
jgi:DNA-directed RNA polymerase II subunit RPB1